MSIFGTPVKGSGGFFSSATTITASAVNTHAGDLIVVMLMYNVATHGTVAFTDTAGNTYTLRPLSTVSGSFPMQVGYCLSATANASNVVQAVISGSTSPGFSAMYVWSIPITGSAPSFDVDSYGHSSGSSNLPLTPSFSTTGTDEIALAMGSNVNSGITYTAGSGYTLDNASFSSGFAGSEHQLFSSTQSGITAGFTQSGSSGWVIAVAAFKAGGGGGGGTAKPVVCIMQ